MSRNHYQNPSALLLPLSLLQVIINHEVRASANNEPTNLPPRKGIFWLKLRENGQTHPANICGSPCSVNEHDCILSREKLPPRECVIIIALFWREGKKGKIGKMGLSLPSLFLPLLKGQISLIDRGNGAAQSWGERKVVDDRSWPVSGAAITKERFITEYGPRSQSLEGFH